MTEPLGSLGGYRLESVLGRGGMGTVYRATHPSFPGRAFAVKVLDGEGRAAPEAAERFQREMRALAAASEHPNVVAVHGGSLAGPRPFFVMDLVEGETLARRAKDAPLEPRLAARLLEDVARAVEHGHQKGVLHRDLKPQNVILGPGDRPFVSDFGLARLVGDVRLTATGTSLGTPEFSAPEQLDGRAAEADARADVYALGATLWFALVGRPVFEAPSAPGLLKRMPGNPHRARPSRTRAIPS